jgi:hypothetical protein
MRSQGRGVQTHEPRYFDDLTAPSDKFNGDKRTNRVANGENNQGRVADPRKLPTPVNTSAFIGTYLVRLPTSDNTLKNVSYYDIIGALTNCRWRIIHGYCAIRDFPSAQCRARIY